MLEAVKFRSIAEIAEVEKIGRSFVNRLLRLTMLAPDIQEAILEGRQGKGLQLEELMGAMPGVWGEQWQCHFFGDSRRECKLETAPTESASHSNHGPAYPREPHDGSLG
jgi:hypothetical protein